MALLGILLWMLSGIVCAIILHWLFHVLTRPKNLPPGPLPLPLIGNAYLFFFRHVPDVLADLKKTYGNVVTLYIGHTLRTVVFLGYHPMVDLFTGGSTAEIVAGRPASHNELRGVQRGIIWAGWPEAKERRRFVLRAFKENGLGLTHMGDHVYQELAAFMSHLEATTGQPVDIGVLLTNHLASCIMQTIYSQRLDIGQSRSALLFSYGKVFFDSSILKHFLSPYLSYILPDEVSLAEQKMEAEMSQWLKSELEKRRPTFDPSNCVDFIDAYLAAEQQGCAIPFLAFNRILVDLFIGGMETVSETMNWAVFYLAHMPDEQERLHRELEAVVPANSWPKLEHRSHLVRMEAFFNEVHRHSNRIEVLFLRATTEDLIIDVNSSSTNYKSTASYVVPSKTAIMFSQIPSNMDVEYWLDPENFRVDRWLSPDGKLVRHEYFLPFGLGKRSCVGEQPARGLLFLCMSYLIQRFSWQLEDQTIPLTACHRGINRNAPRHYNLIMSQRM